MHTMNIKGEVHDSFSTVVEKSGNYRVCLTANSKLFSKDPQKTYEMSLTFLAFDHSEEDKNLKDKGTTNFVSKRSVDRVEERLQML